MSLTPTIALENLEDSIEHALKATGLTNSHEAGDLVLLIRLRFMHYMLNHLNDRLDEVLATTETPDPD